MMEWAALVYPVGIVVMFLLVLMVEMHGARKDQKKIEDGDVGFMVVLSIIWPFTLVFLLVFGFVTGVKYIVNKGVK